MKFTKEEISLCKQVAEKWRKAFKWGDWYYFKKKVHLIWSKPEPIMDDSCIPLWTISDCLEFLRKKEFNVIQLWKMERKRMWICAFSSAIYSRRLEKREWKRGKTPLEACLKAVIAVLEEKK